MDAKDEMIRMMQSRIDAMEQELLTSRNLSDQLLESQSLFREVTDNIQQVFWMTDPSKNKMLFLSKAYESIWGRDVESGVNDPMSFIESIHPDDREHLFASFPKQVEGTYDIEYRIMNGSGEIRWIHDKAFPIKNQTGEIYRVVGFAQDITEKKQLLNELENEKEKSERLLYNILPEEVARELRAKGDVDARYFEDVTVMFTDFKGFTQLSEQLSPAELVEELNICFREFDHIITKNNIEKIKTIGDAYMCAGGLPVSNTTHARDVVNAALEINRFMYQHLLKRKMAGKPPFEIRIGINTGPVVAGIVGVKKFAFDIWGDTVNIASRMESSGEAGKVNISRSTYEVVRGEFNCTHRGKIYAKNKGEIDMYFVESGL